MSREMFTGAVLLIVGVVFGGLGGYSFGDIINPDIGITTVEIDENTRVLAANAEKRFIIQRTGAPSAENSLCAEPSPDVALDIDHALSFVTEFQTALGDDSAEGSADLENTLKTLNKQLVERSQGLQFVRDLIFRACEARANGFIDEKVYADFLNFALTASVAMATIETMASREVPTEQQAQMMNFLSRMITTP